MLGRKRTQPLGGLGMFSFFLVEICHQQHQKRQFYCREIGRRHSGCQVIWLPLALNAYLLSNIFIRTWKWKPETRSYGKNQYFSIFFTWIRDILEIYRNIPFPYSDRFIIWRRDKSLVFIDKSNCIDWVQMTVIFLHNVARPDVPTWNLKFICF